MVAVAWSSLKKDRFIDRRNGENKAIFGGNLRFNYETCSTSNEAATYVGITQWTDILFALKRIF